MKHSNRPCRLNVVRVSGTSQNGFALVLTLLMLAFVVVLLLTISTIIRIESKASANSLKQAQARQNALLGLKVALAQLQSEAGPDQRATGRADLLDNNAATPTADGVTQPFWTGVWRTVNTDTGANNELDVGTEPTLRSWSTADERSVWLVSNPDPQTALDPRTWSGETSGATADAVVLARQVGALGSSGEGVDVVVPLVPLRDPTASRAEVGNFAYWVEDEGIKAKVNLAPGLASTLAGGPTAKSMAINARHYLSPATIAADLALSPRYRQALRDASPELRKIVSTQSLETVLGAPFQSADDGYARSSPDITTWSQGLLSDIRKGGLKTDLTAAFESLDQFNRLVLRAAPGRDETNGGTDDSVGGKIWRVPGVGIKNSVYRDGVRWHTFYSFYNTYKKTHPNYVGNPSGTFPWWEKTPEGLGGIGGTEADLSLPVLNVTGQTRAVAVGRLLPALMGIRMPVFFSTYDKGDSTMGIRLHFSPKLVLYNPWNIALKPSADPASNSNQRARFFFTSNIMNANRVKITNRTTGVRLYSGAAQPEAGNANLAPANSDLSFAPGQVKMFGSKQAIEGTSSYFRYNMPSEFPLVDEFGEFFNYWEVPLEGLLGVNDNIEITFETRIDTGSAADANSVRWLFDNQSQGVLTRNTLAANQEYVVIDDQPASSFARDLEDPPTPLAVLFMRAKGLFPNNLPNVPAMGGPGALWNPIFLTKNSYFWEVEVLVGAQYNEESEFQTDGTNSFWGPVDVGRAGGDTHRILKEIFNQPLLSIGQFKNTDMAFIDSLIPVGNSWADPELANQTDGNNSLLWYLKPDPTDQLVTVDDSFLNNEALFDKFFFSTIPPGNLPGNTVFPDEWNGFDQAQIDSGAPLLNPRLKYHRPNNQSPEVADLRDMDKAAAHLLVDGAFNVNSTSVPAWRALLGSLRYQVSPTETFPVPRFITGLTTRPAADDYPSGMRVLTDQQLDALAAAIVEQVKLRGPFLSMADFVNRRRVAGEIGKKGALQAAIDNSGINDAALSELGQATDLTGPKAGDGLIVLPEKDAKMNWKHGITPAVPENTAAGAPGVITQADFLQALAPVLTARSDTFRIRFYGESFHPALGRSSNPVSAMGEAVVQRLPDFIDLDDPALSAGDNLGNATLLDTLNAVNQENGRRFKIVSFRWLNPDEI